MKALIVGGSGVAGQCALRALKQFDPGAEIWATSSKDGDVAGATHTIRNIDINNPGAIEKLKGFGEKLDYLFYTPAFGSVGNPVAAATRAEVQAAKAFCLDPMVVLTEAIRPKMTVAYTAYYFKPHLLAFYGALAYVKYATEKLAVENPAQYKCLRIGSFVSKATRGIGLLLQRMAKTAPHLKPLMELYAESGMKFSDFFFDYISKEEKKNIAGDKPYRMTTEEDIVAGHLQLLKGEPAPIINVLGEQIWAESALPLLPAEMARANEILS
ncbi:MAG: SDR family NAD(P)-dependent oxidoreductase [Spirochaetes bacterium]|nr:SDR family NAD(P)-dependent oxidoreductase [Spirochaetota bacterium]MBX3721130.1 SDR family NAD(P)-dependent oxidoreductase [Turneriella sp.]